MEDLYCSLDQHMTSLLIQICIWDEEEEEEEEEVREWQPPGKFNEEHQIAEDCGTQCCQVFWVAF